MPLLYKANMWASPFGNTREGIATYTEPAVRTYIINIEHDGTPVGGTFSYQAKSALFESGMHGQETDGPKVNQRPGIPEEFTHTAEGRKRAW